MHSVWSRGSLVVTLLLTSGATIGAAQGVPDSTRRARGDTVQLKELEVRGTRSAQYLRNTTPVPVDVVPLRTISKLGQPELTQILNYVVPSFQSTTQSQTDGNDHVDFAQLRGLGADQTLVLINGKRRHASALVHVGDNIGEGTAGVDLNSIPAAAIDRIEILRDGAAAQYGSDAIAGVINIILKQQADGGAASTQAGLTSRGDGEQIRADANYGFRVGRNGFLNVTAEYRHRQPTNRVGRWTGNVYFGNLFNFGDFGNNGEYNSEAEFQQDLQKIQQRGFDLDNVQRIGDSKLTNATLFLNSAIPVADSTEVYGFGGLTYRTGEASAFYRFPADQAVSDLNIYPDGYLPLITSDITDRAITGGVRTTRAGWNVDFSNTYGSNGFGFGVNNTLNPSLRDESPTSFQAGQLGYAQNTTRLDVSKRYEFTRAIRSLNVALGAEYRVERYQITAGQEGSWRNYAPGAAGQTPDGSQLDGGSEGFPGFQPINEVNRRRSNTGLYADVEADLNKYLLVSAAGRFEDYSDFGQKVIGKAAALVRLGHGVGLRGAINNGFRAPSLPQLYTNKISTFFRGNEQLEVGLFNNESAVVRALGVAPLRPETSTNYSAGVTFSPDERLRVSVDGYIINVKNRIVVSGVLDRGDNPDIDATLAAFPEVQAVQFFTNAIDTRTRGLDVQASYPFLLGEGVLTLTGAANFNETRIRGDVRAPAGLGTTPLFDPQARSWIEDALPPSKITLTGQYAVGNFTGLVRTTRFGAVESVNLFGPNETVPAAFITDVNVGYTFRNRVTLQVGANNVFDVFPPLQDPANSFFGIFKYSRVTPYGIRGANFYSSVTLGL
jgi:iron complex outermembrane receptor protein